MFSSPAASTERMARRIGDRAVGLVQRLGASHGVVFNQMVE